MQYIISSLAIFILLVWLIVTVIDAIPINSRILNRLHDLYFISPFIPRWTFFAPNPGVHDFYLLYRDVADEEHPGPWQHLTHLNTSWNFSRILWNSTKRECKALADVTVSLACMWSEDDKTNDTIKLSIPYIIILNYISNMPRSNSNVCTQFLLMQMSALDNLPEVVFVSGLHKIT